MTSRYGRALLTRYRNFKTVQIELSDPVKRLEAHWENLEFEIKYFAGVQDFVGDEIQLRFEKLVNSLYSKLQAIGLQLERTATREKKIFSRKTTFLGLLKSSLEEATTELSESNTLLQPLLFLLPRISDSRIDQKAYTDSNKAISAVHNLRQALKVTSSRSQAPFIVFEDFEYDRRLIQHTTVTIKRLPEGRDVIIDSIPCVGPAAGNLSRDIRDLARVLKEVEPMTFGIPSCRGLVKIKGPNGKLSKLEMVFDVPSELENPRSLRNLLISLNLGNGGHPINARIQLAKRLARTVFFVHSAEFVHKNFRPETIILFDHRDRLKDQTLSREIGFPFLVGFQKIRLASGATAYLGDSAWEQNIYRHPSRQGEYPEQAYSMQHDIYSLGVCLLEIALWKSFVLLDAYGQNALKSKESEQVFKDTKGPFEVKERLINMAQEMIPTRLGNRYAEVTISCLKCLDEDSAELLAEDNTPVGVSYIEKVSRSTNSRYFNGS